MTNQKKTWEQIPAPTILAPYVNMLMIKPNIDSVSVAILQSPVENDRGKAGL